MLIGSSSGRFHTRTPIKILYAFLMCHAWYYFTLLNVSCVDLMMISGATAQTGPWPPLRVS
jgi:hypothetical protein